MTGRMIRCFQRLVPRGERWQAAAGVAMVAGAVAVFLVVGGCYDDEDDGGCGPAYMKVMDAINTTLEPPSMDPIPLPSEVTGTCALKVSVQGGRTADVYFHVPAGRHVVSWTPGSIDAEETMPGLYVLHNVPSGQTIQFFLDHAEYGDQCRWGVGRWDTSLGRWAEYQAVTAPIELGGSSTQPADGPAAGAATARDAASASGMFYWLTGAFNGNVTVERTVCQQAVDLLQTGDVFLALRYPVDPALRRGTGWLDPVVIRGETRPRLTLSSGGDDLVALPLEIRPQWLQFAQERLPSAQDEAWTVLGAAPSPRITCPDGLDEWAWSVDLKMSLDFRTDATTYLDHVLESYLCYAGQQSPASPAPTPSAVPVVRGEGSGLVREDGVTCFGPFPIRAVDWAGGPDPPYWLVVSKSFSRAAPGGHVEVAALLMNLGSSDLTLDVSVDSSMGLPWKLYLGDVSKPDLGRPVQGPVSVEGDGYAYVWMVADLPQDASGFDTTRVTAVQTGKTPSWGAHILQVGAWSPPPTGSGWHAWVPVGSHASGANGSRWRTDAGLLNPGGGTIPAEVRLHASGGVHRMTVDVPARGQVILADVVDQMGYTGGGPVEVSAPGELLFTSRSYSAISSGAACFPSGTLGQSLDGMAVTQGLVAGQRAYIPQLVENAAFRTNIGLANTGSGEAAVTVHLHDAAGAEVGSYAVNLDPGQWKQENRPFANRAGKDDMAAGYAVVEVTSGAGVLAYGSVVDNRTNDPTTIPMILAHGAGSKETWIPVAVHAPGANGSQWRTTLGLLNPGTGTANVTLTLHSGSQTVNAAYTLPAGSQLILDDLAGTMGVDGAGPLRVSSGLPVVVTSRTFTRIGHEAACLPDGTLGQALPATARDAALRTGETAYLPHLMENSAFRSNIGFANIGSSEAGITVRLFDGGGVELGSFQLRVAPQTWVQENRPFHTRAGQSDLDTGWAAVEVTAGDGVLVYGSVVDNITNDPTTVIPRRRM